MHFILDCGEEERKGVEKNEIEADCGGRIPVWRGGKRKKKQNIDEDVEEEKTD